MEFLDIINSFVSSVTPQEWTIGGIASFLSLSALRGLFLFTFIIKIPEAIENTKITQPFKALILTGFDLIERIGLAYDVAFNTVVMTVLCLDLPGGLHTFSFRMGKYIHEDEGWRNKFATKVCSILSSIDKDHCTRVYLNGF